jgi:hypothetical protein
MITLLGPHPTAKTVGSLAEAIAQPLVPLGVGDDGTAHFAVRQAEAWRQELARLDRLIEATTDPSALARLRAERQRAAREASGWQAKRGGAR